MSAITSAERGTPAPQAACPAPPSAPDDIVRELVDRLDAMVAYWDADQVCAFANAAYLDWFGKSAREMVGITLAQLLGPLYSMNLPYIEAAYRGEKQVFEREIPLPDGTIRHSLATYTPRVVDGKVSGICVHVADVGPLKKLEGELRDAKERAERLATHDHLTGVGNRSLLFARMADALALARRKHHQLAVIAIDVDDFKSINDSYGHTVGDRFLVELAEQIRRSVRASDLVTRPGGDEFIVLCPQIDSPAEVEALGRRLLGIATTPMTLPGVSVAATLSLGIALFPRDCETAEGLLAASDRALYRAKHAGKNQLAFSQPQGRAP